VPSEQLELHAPDALAGFTANGDAELHDTPLPNGGQMTAVRRTYVRGAQKLQLELSDPLHVPALREAVMGQQGQARTTKQVESRGIEINGHPALVQRRSASRTAIVNMLINGRFLANVKVSPVDSTDPAIEVANALPVAEIAKLAPTAALPEKSESAKSVPGKTDAPDDKAAAKIGTSADEPAH
jgi:hypothetical protein